MPLGKKMVLHEPKKKKKAQEWFHLLGDMLWMTFYLIGLKTS